MDGFQVMLPQVQRGCSGVMSSSIFSKRVPWCFRIGKLHHTSKNNIHVPFSIVMSNLLDTDESSIHFMTEFITDILPCLGKHWDFLLV